MAAIDGTMISRENSAGFEIRTKCRHVISNLSLNLIKGSLRNRQQNVRIPRET